MIDYDKIKIELEKLIEDLGSPTSFWCGGSATTQQITLANGKEAQIKIELVMEEDDFDDIVP